MKYLGIVGSSHLSEVEEMDVRKTIPFLVNSFRLNNPFDDIGVVTGDAKGVDKLVWEYVKLDEELTNNSRRYEANGTSWKYYINIAIATCADIVISITTKLKTEGCYHCNENHQRSGGCWTAKYARKLGKEGITIVI
ncbi:MAG: hypothetical protein KGI05_07000 [Thaumarchaeota archaeon]|nr:hypothetical protein [Nitrososphaerota archaeon]